MVNSAHPWVLAGPWYRWPTPGQPSAGRQSAPVIQKYETANFVNEFLQNPQHSLVFLDSEDRVFELNPPVAPVPKPGVIRKKFSDQTLQNTGIRKLFLDTHKRFYLVVCELHCDTAGFPCVDRKDVCEAGFVVRRLAVQIPRNAEKELRKVIRDGATATALQAAAEKLGVQSELQGWISSGFDRIGKWQKVEETPPVNNTETIHPLYPLVPDPRLAQHAGKGRTIYFGVIPTGGADTDDLGNARFNDRNLYEIRCFVRRHKFPCPKTNTRNDCHGPLIWSRRSEQFQLASHFDLIGTSNRPVSIQMPNLPMLQALVAADPKIGRKAPVKMISPPQSNLETSGKLPNLNPAAGSPGAAICSFSIPLITIVATFVFKLFLPIVVFVFQLWWMLVLRFCIPPSFSLTSAVALGLAAKLDADLDVKFAADVQADLSANLGTDAAASFNQSFSPGVQAELVSNLAINFAQDAPSDLPLDPPPPLPPPNKTATPDQFPVANLPSITDNLEYYTDVPLP